MALLRANAVRAIKADPADARNMGLRPGVRAITRLACGRADRERIAADETRRRLKAAGGGDEDMGEFARTAAPGLKRLRCGCGRLKRALIFIRYGSDARTHEEHESVQALDLICAHSLLRQRAQASVRRGERAFAQEQVWRKPFQRAADETRAIERLHKSFGDDAQARRRTVEAEDVRQIAKSVFAAAQAAISLHVDAPVENVLTFMAARRKTQRLDHIPGGGIEGLDDLMADLDAHGGLSG